MSPARGLVVVEQYGHRAGGQAVAERLATFAQSMGSAVSIVAPPGDWPEETFPVPVTRFPSGLTGLVAAIRVTRRSLESSSVVVANGPRVALSVLIASWLTGAESVLYLHNYPHRGRTARAQRWVLGQLSRRFDRTVMVAEFLRAVGNRPDALALHNTPSTDLVLPSLDGTGGSSGVIKFMGRADAVKGLDVLERALAVARLPEDHVVQIAVGVSLHDSAPVGSAEPDVATGGRSSTKVEYVGPRTATWFAPGDVVCMPSRLELSPMVLLEAVGRGAVVIASDAGGTPEIIEDGVNGFLFHSTDSEDLANVLERVAALEAERFAEVQVRGLETVKRLTTEWEAFWRGLLLPRAGVGGPDVA